MKFRTLKEFDDEKSAAWEAHRTKFDCQHADTAVRIRTLVNGSTQFIAQCLHCGRSVGQALKKDQCSGLVTKPFDDGLIAAFEKERNHHSENLKNRFSREAFFKSYDDYLSSAAWSITRSKVLQRAKHTCEGCLENKATEVHHLTYEHIGAEFMFELVALCNSCHERMHAKEDQ